MLTTCSIKFPKETLNPSSPIPQPKTLTLTPMEETLATRTSQTTQIPSWYSPESGIYSSKHHPRSLPQDPFQDLPSFVLNHDYHHLTALVDAHSGFSIQYKDLYTMVRSMASGLHQCGICSNQVVLILLPNTVFFPVIFLGVLSIGAVATTMNPLSSSQEIKKQVGCTNVVMVFTSSELVGKIDGLGLGIKMVVVPEKLPYASKDFASFDRLVTGNGNYVLSPRPVIRQTDTAAILYSSGTSGSNKGVVITHGNLIAAVELFVRFEASQYDEDSRENVYLDALPMFHVYGLSLCAVGLLSLGSKIVVMRRFNVEDAIGAIDRYRVTHFPVVPPIMGALIRAKDATSSGLGSLRQVSSGAAPLSRKVIDDFMEAFPHVDFIQGYGMTESTAVGTRGFNTAEFKKYGSAGLLAPNMQAKVVDWKTGSCFPPGGIGELWLRGPGIMKGYLNDESETSLTIDKDGWLRTGDITYFDQDGYLYVLDRLKDTIKYKGFQIAPADLEGLLICHPEVLDVAVTFAEDEEAGEIPVAYVVRVPGSSLSSAEVIQYVAKQVAPYKKVRRVVFVDSIPKSPSGKILRRLLRNKLVISRI